MTISVYVLPRFLGDLPVCAVCLKEADVGYGHSAVSVPLALLPWELLPRSTPPGLVQVGIEHGH